MTALANSTHAFCMTSLRLHMLCTTKKFLQLMSLLAQTYRLLLPGSILPAIESAQ